MTTSPAALRAPLRVALGLASIGAWTIAQRQVDSSFVTYALFPVLAYGVLQLLEGVARYEPGPTLPHLSATERELLAAGVALAMAFVAATSDSEGDTELPIGGDAAMIVLMTAGLHGVAARPKAPNASGWLGVHLGVSLAIGIALAAAAIRLGVPLVQALALPLLALAAGIGTLPWSWRAAIERARYRAPSAIDEALRVRVAAAEREEGDDRLFAVIESNDERRLLARRPGDAELVASPALVPDVPVGHFVLVRGARIVTSTRGGDGYRGEEAYERLDGCEEALPIGALPLPPPPRRPRSALAVEATLGLGVAVLGALAFVAGRWALAPVG